MNDPHSDLQALVQSAQEAFAEATTPADLENAKARFLGKATGVPMAALDFDETALDPHLRMNLRLAERDGRVLATSRDLDELRRRFGERAERSAPARRARSRRVLPETDARVPTDSLPKPRQIGPEPRARRTAGHAYRACQSPNRRRGT